MASDQVSLNSTVFHDDFCSLRWWSEQLFSYNKKQPRGASFRPRPCTPVLLERVQPCLAQSVPDCCQRSPPAALRILHIEQALFGRADSPAKHRPELSMDAYGDHLLCCRKSGFIQRHQTIVQQLWHFCNTAGFNATCEVSTQPLSLLCSRYSAILELKLNVFSMV